MTEEKQMRVEEEPGNMAKEAKQEHCSGSLYVQGQMLQCHLQSSHAAASWPHSHGQVV